MTNPAPGALAWFEVATDDPDAAEKFYGSLFDWSFEADGPGSSSGMDYRNITASGATEPDTEPGPPVPGFAELSAQAAVASLRTLDRAAALAALAFEQAHGNRRAVLAAARIRAGTTRAD